MESMKNSNDVDLRECLIELGKVQACLRLCRMPRQRVSIASVFRENASCRKNKDSYIDILVKKFYNESIFIIVNMDSL